MIGYAPPMATQLAPEPALPVTIEDVRTAHRRIADAIVRTPTLISRTLSEMTGATVYLKFENLQFTAAYKERGALNTLLQLSDAARAKGLLLMPSGKARHIIRLLAPLTIEAEVLEEGLDILEQCLAELN